jgi:uracil-DNA glycosylase
MQNELFQRSSEPNRLSSWQPDTWPVAAGWGDTVAEFLSSSAGQALARAVQARLAAGAVIYPPTPFKALELTPLSQVRVVILGQDPYHRAGQAQGLAFSVAPGIKIPPSLRNIFKEIQRESGKLSIIETENDGKSGSLVKWAEQGVLLLNTCLTVEDGLPASHAKLGWEVLTDALISLVAQQNKNLVFMLWGAHAQAKQGLIRAENSGEGNHLSNYLNNEHLVLCANHPSPLSAMRRPAPFIGCGHFGLANAFLAKHGLVPINW